MFPPKLIKKPRKLKAAKGTSEVVTFETRRYFDAEGCPTCALDFENNQFCEHFRTLRMGTYESCVFAPQEAKYLKLLNRRVIKEKNQIGGLIPGDWCPLFSALELKE